MKIFNWIKSLFQPEIIGQPLIATIIALIFAPFSIYLGFEVTSRLSKPIISIEYVTKYDQNIYTNTSEIERKINTIINSPLYRKYRMENLNNFRSIDFNFLLKGNDKMGLSHALDKFKKYIHLDILNTKKKLKDLPNKDNIDKKVLLSELLPNEEIADEDLEERISSFYSKKINGDKTILDKVNELDNFSKKNVISATQLNVSLLNKGSTDGLIRNLGFLTYEKIKFRIKKTPPPSNPEDLLAVPTFVVNKSFGLYAENAIGKIQKNTMSEFWFTVDVKNTQSSICANGGFYLLELFDQDKNIIKKQLSCN